MYFEGFGVFVLVVVAVVVFYLLRAIRMVPQGYNYTVERFGKYAATLSPGLNLINPIFSRVAAKIDIREQVLADAQQHELTLHRAAARPRAPARGCTC